MEEYNIDYYTPDEVWDLFQLNKGEIMDEPIVIAECEETEIEIHMTGVMCEGEVIPEIIVYLEGQEFYSEKAIDEKDCKHTVDSIYDKYLDPDNLEYYLEHRYDEPNADEFDYEEFEKAAFDRDEDLHNVVYEYLTGLLDCSPETLLGFKETDEICDDLLEKTCRYLHSRWDISVYRPTIVTDSDGVDHYSEYPYEEFEGLVVSPP